MNNERKYHCTIAELMAAADLIQGALVDDRHQELLARLPATFATDLAAAIAALATAVSAQQVARGKVTATARDVQKATSKCGLATGTVRAMAKRAMSDQDAVLHTEFTVGHVAPEGVEHAIARAVTVHEACGTYAELLSQRGWGAAQTTALAELIATLKSAHEAREAAEAVKLSATTQMINMANTVFDLCRTVQIVANEMYPAADAERDATIVESRRQFRLGVFPPHANATEDEPTSIPPVTGGGSTTASTPAAPSAASGS